MNKTILKFLLCTLVAVTWHLPTQAADKTIGFVPQNGDIVFQSLGRSPLMNMIAGTTGSAFTHCGIVVQNEGKWSVIEAVGPVRLISLDAWIQNGEKDGFAAYRLNADYADVTDEFVADAKAYLGRPYDIRYRFDDEKIYCSELIFKAFRDATGEELGKVVRLKELDWEPHVELIKQIEGGSVPLEREIITPVAVALADQLSYVYSRDITVSQRVDE